MLVSLNTRGGWKLRMAFFTLRVLYKLKAVYALKAVGTLKAVYALKAVGTLKAVYSLKAVHALMAIFFVVGVCDSALSQERGVEYDWELKRDRDGIQVYLSKVPGSKFRAIRSVMNVDADTASLVALVMDLPNCARWAAMCERAHVVRRLSDTESLVYTLNNVPFPVRDRDVYAQVYWSVDETTGRVSMQSRATRGEFPKTKGVVRVEDAVSQWHFTPRREGGTRVESYAHIDPNGATPAWLTNILIVDSPFKTMRRMRQLLQQGHYKDAEVTFLTN